jgi:hypothetical protein
MAKLVNSPFPSSPSRGRKGRNHFFKGSYVLDLLSDDQGRQLVYKTFSLASLPGQEKKGGVSMTTVQDKIRKAKGIARRDAEECPEIAGTPSTLPDGVHLTFVDGQLCLPFLS